MGLTYIETSGDGLVLPRGPFSRVCSEAAAAPCRNDVLVFGMAGPSLNKTHVHTLPVQVPGEHVQDWSHCVCKVIAGNRRPDGAKCRA